MEQNVPVVRGEEEFSSKMDIKILERRENSVKFVIAGAKQRFVNALRRAMIADVPKLAIDEVNIHENTSLLYDEQLALRLALLPLKIERKTENYNYNYYGHDDQILMTLKAISPEREGYTLVYSKELISSDPSVAVAFENIPIVKLITTEREVGGRRSVTRQRIVLEAIAKLGRGRDHAKWQPVTVCSYRDIDMPDEDEDEDEGGDGAPRKNKTDFLFTVESDGALPVDMIIEEAARIMRKKCNSLLDELNEMN